MKKPRTKFKDHILTKYFIENPLASAREAATACGTSWQYAYRILSKRQTPKEVFVAESKAKTPKDVFTKHDSNKLPWHLLPTDAVEEVLKVLDYGAKKYSSHNWCAGAEWSRYYDAMHRHLWSWWAGETLDEETRKSHLAHAACCLLFLISYEKRNIGTDDRSKP